MRIIEPRHFKELKPHKVRRKLPRKWLFVMLGLVILGSGLAFAFKLLNTPTKGHITPEPNQQSTNTVQNPNPQPSPTKKLKIFTHEQFRDFYNNFAYPNTIELTRPFPITSNEAADVRIRNLAEARGYKLRSVPLGALSSVDGFPLQELAIKGWNELKAAAATEGLRLGIISGYRSLEDQRAIFNSRLSAAGATAEAVAAGTADAQVQSVLASSSVPGYSRHHTGYTVDLKCNDLDFNYFETTPCFTWMSKNNYENAKKFGWIPSYPPGVPNQGPDPEAWEYVWVGTAALYE